MLSGVLGVHRGKKRRLTSYEWRSLETLAIDVHVYLGHTQKFSAGGVAVLCLCAKPSKCPLASSPVPWASMSKHMLPPRNVD